MTPIAGQLSPPIRGVATSAAVSGLKAIFKPGFDHAQAGVMLLDIDSSQSEQFELNLATEADAAGGERASHAQEVRPELMAAQDSLNDRYGRGTLKSASADLGVALRKQVMEQGLRTLAYTTRWEDMTVIRA